MPGERSTLWIGAATVGATVGAVAVSAAVLWNLAAEHRAYFVAEIKTISGKVDKANEAVADMKKIVALDATTQQLGALGSAIKKINDGLAELQKSTSLDGIKNAVAQVDSRLEKTALALAEIKTATARAGEAQAAGDGARDRAIASLEATVAGLKAGVAELKSGLAGNASAQTTSLAEQSRSLEAIAKSVDKIKATTEAQQAAIRRIGEQAEDETRDRSKEMVVVYVAGTPAGAAPDSTSSIAPAPAVSIRFEKIGSTNPDNQAQTVIGDLKRIIKGRGDCTILVAGYADTLGTDGVNLEVSRERAEAVAARLRTAFAGENVAIKNVAWGERQLKVWTPDGKSEKANRRVDIGVDCKN